MKSQQPLKEQRTKQPKPLDQVFAEPAKPKREEIIRWEGEGGAVIPTGDLKPKKHNEDKPV